MKTRIPMIGLVAAIGLSALVVGAPKLSRAETNEEANAAPAKADEVKDGAEAGVAASVQGEDPDSDRVEDGAELARQRDELARATFLAAHTAFGEGRYEDALAGFRRAYELSGRHQLLFNVGTTADRLRREDEALEAFTIYIRENPNAGNRREVEARMRVLERSIEDRRAAEREKEEERRRASEAERALVELHQSRAADGEHGMSTRGKRAVIASSAILGAALVGLVIGLVVSGDSSNGDEKGYAPYQGGSDGSVIFALERQPLIRW